MIIIWRQRQQWYIVTILYRIIPHTQATKVNIIIINIDDTILQLLLLPQCLPLFPLPDLFCLPLCNLREETKLKNRWHVILMHGVHFLLVLGWLCSAARAGGVRVRLYRILEIGVGLLEAVLVPSTQILPVKLGLQHYNIIFTPKQSLGVVGIKELDILHTQIFANHLEFGNNDIIVWEAVQLEPYRDANVGDVSVGCIILA